MNAYERVELTLKHKEPDRTPIFEYVLLSPMADYILGRPYVSYAEGRQDVWKDYVKEKGWENAVRQYAVDRLEICEKLGHDMMFLNCNPPPKGWAPPEQPNPDTENLDPVEKLYLRNSKGEERLENFDGQEFDDTFLIFHVMMEEMKKRDMHLPILAGAYFHGIWTDTDLMETIVLEPETARKHYSLATGFALKYIEKYKQIGIKQVAIGGDFAGNRLIISPKSYKDLIVPELRKLSEHIHQYGGWAINASDGNLWPVIDEFLFESGADGYVEIDMKAGMDLKELKTRYGSRIVLYGNMDCGEILSFSEPEDIRKCTIKCLEDGWGSGGHIFCASNAIAASISAANYLAMVNAYREYFGMKPVKL